MDVKGRVAVISGGGTGMGWGAAQALTAAGARCALLGRRESVVRQRSSELPGSIGIACDVSDESSVERALSAVEDQLGTASIMINSAGRGPLINLVSPDGTPAPGSIIRDVIATNVLGVLYMSRGFASRLAKTPAGPDGLRGVLINVSSVGAADGVVGSTYAASKGAVDAACLSLAREFDFFGIRVCTIAPGGIDTELFREGTNEEIVALLNPTIPSLRRPGRPEEFGALALHLCQNDYLNAVNIRLDGGHRIPFTFDVGGGAQGGATGHVPEWHAVAE
jgi:NAD(P)-dependent dehydrogenase (short-subunit alcohol dehydrogenase family)